MTAKSKSSRDALVTKLYSHVPKLANGLISQLGLPRDGYDDLVAAGYLGLVEAAERFDSNKNDDFQGYASWRIRGEMIDHIRRSAQLTRSAWRTLKMIERYQDQLEGASTFQAHSLNTVMDRIGTVGLRTRMESLEDSGEYAEPASEIDPEKDLLLTEQRKLFLELIDTFPENERKILRGHYFEGKAFNEIQLNETGTTKSWVSRLHARALERFREKWTERLEVIKSESEMSDSL